MLACLGVGGAREKERERHTDRYKEIGSGKDWSGYAVSYTHLDVYKRQK